MTSGRTGSRRKGREAALQALFLLEANPDLSPEQGLGLLWRELGGDEAGRPYAERLVQGVIAHRAEIDELIGRVSRTWRLERMARVDRNVLRIAVHEMAHLADVPAEVAINEAIEIARRYGASESPAFVNGVLDRARAAIGGVGP